MSRLQGMFTARRHRRPGAHDDTTHPVRPIRTESPSPASSPALDADQHTAATMRRRGLIAGAVVAAAAAVVIDQRPDPAAAANGNPLTLGADNASESLTNLNAGPGAAVGLQVISAHQFGAGLAGYGNQFGVIANGLETGSGVFAFSNASQKQGIFASSGPKATNGLGVNAVASGPGGIGGQFEGTRAPLRLVPAASDGRPTTGAHQAGELFVDRTGSLFLCTVDGSPGTWIALGGPSAGPVLHTLPTPERFVDTRSGLGGVTGPVPGGTTNVFTMTGRDGKSGNPTLRIPDTARTLVGNLTVIGAAGIPLGSFSTVWPGGPLPTVSSINFGPGAVTGAVANSFLVGLGGVNGHGAVSVFNSSPCDYILDISAYYADA